MRVLKVHSLNVEVNTEMKTPMAAGERKRKFLKFQRLLQSKLYCKKYQPKQQIC